MIQGHTVRVDDDGEPGGIEVVGQTAHGVKDQENVPRDRKS